jgi:MFS family permease
MGHQPSTLDWTVLPLLWMFVAAGHFAAHVILHGYVDRRSARTQRRAAIFGRRNSQAVLAATAGAASVVGLLEIVRGELGAGAWWLLAACPVGFSVAIVVTSSVAFSRHVLNPERREAAKAVQPAYSRLASLFLTVLFMFGAGCAALILAAVDPRLVIAGTVTLMMVPWLALISWARRDTDAARQAA